MLFNSLEFGLFFPAVLILYWLVAKNNFRTQNLLLLVASYFFYGWWDYRFLLLLMFSTLLDYYAGEMIYRSPGSRKKLWLWISVAANLGFLGFFKYFNFFVDSLVTAIRSTGVETDLWTLNILLPVGISFYTFHGLSYVFDIYRGNVKPAENVVNYGVFVSFFPLLVAGPIERATHLLPQVQGPRTFEYGKAVDGLAQILWGLFKKIVIADNCAEYVNQIFGAPGQHSSTTLAIGAFLFAIQIYCDFSGYSDIALGTARLLGFELLRNFAYPYFSRDIAEFWRRWHISLSSWFRDYVYIPLGGSRRGLARSIANILVIFLLSGFWHGANWTFIFWGLLNAVYFLPLLLTSQNRQHLEIVAKGKFLPSLKETLQIAVTFGMTCFAWIFFRADTMGDAFTYVAHLFSASDLAVPDFIPKHLFLLIGLFVLIEWLGRHHPYGIAGTRTLPRPVKWIFYYCMILGIIVFATHEQEFIYFQF